MGYPFYTLHDLIIQLPHKLHRAHTSSNSVSLCFPPTHHRTGSRRLCNSAVVRSCHATVARTIKSLSVNHLRLRRF
ncbi:hypothetical protein HanXRQr2_Chr09g0407561 [Helianthus annuus]|uniref:Uncharacterized protein n=1 Tax=Helianthus annuus TaxID=4232 RepID=A0A9K3I948_HELAN|nr:hypothetical protein HanXRQr2_Chr09g0407561 [Helianthus annuus]KAJ0527512.1 hypothetical protein HanHA300_Chr09g0334771 [Helianthus annuus]KAJ0536242.1 hypothetical protein HanIR_Chr09g0439381 [Helianthus annuus]KAJ0543919.1 hypothetical protein HanHA89_Chr09g0355821 [Helianthus annuus]KAJ0708975.1 hypothetical protein HanLR1_Chr09g0335151 [Helianthus annuus]